MRPLLGGVRRRHCGLCNLLAGGAVAGGAQHDDGVAVQAVQAVVEEGFILAKGGARTLEREACDSVPKQSGCTAALSVCCVLRRSRLLRRSLERRLQDRVGSSLAVHRQVQGVGRVHLFFPMRLHQRLISHLRGGNFPCLLHAVKRLGGGAHRC